MGKSAPTGVLPRARELAVNPQRGVERPVHWDRLVSLISAPSVYSPNTLREVEEGLGTRP